MQNKVVYSVRSTFTSKMSGNDTGNHSLADSTSSDFGGESASEVYPSVVTCIVTVAVVFILLNTKVVICVLFNKFRQTRPVPLLVAHVATLSNFIGFSMMFNTNDSVSLAHIPEYMCRFTSYLRSVLFAAFSINTFFIVYERLHPSRYFQEKLFLTRRILIIWLVSLVFSLPTIGMTQPAKEFHLMAKQDMADKEAILGSCVPVPLFGNIYLTILYELLRFGLFHAAIAMYMVYGLIKAQSEINHLKTHKFFKNVIHERKWSNIIQLIYFHLISYLLISLPAGLYVFYCRVLSRLGKLATVFPDQDGAIPVEHVEPFIAVGIFVYFMATPSISLFLLECNIQHFFSNCFCFCVCCIECVRGQRENEYSEELPTPSSRYLQVAWAQLRDIRNEQRSRETGSTHSFPPVAFIAAEVSCEKGKLRGGVNSYYPGKKMKDGGKQEKHSSGNDGKNACKFEDGTTRDQNLDVKPVLRVHPLQ